jgi:hypothetical protein
MSAILFSIVVFHSLASLVLLVVSAGENALSVRKLFHQRHDHRAEVQLQTSAERRNNLQLPHAEPESVARAA